MSRARFRFLRMLLPSGNSRVSLTLNSLIRALFRRVFFRELFRRDFYRALFRGGFFCALFRRGFSRGLFCGGSYRALFRRGFFRALFRRGFFGALIQTGVSTHRIVWMNWYVRCLFFEILLNYCETSRSILSKSKRKSTYQRLNQLKLKSSKKRPEAWHRIKSY